MKAVTPKGMPVDPQVTDLLVLGLFATPGAPGVAHEPYIAFYRAGHPFQVVCLRDGDVLGLYVPSSSFDGRVARVRVVHSTRGARVPAQLDFCGGRGSMSLSALPSRTGARVIRRKPAY